MESVPKIIHFLRKVIDLWTAHVLQNEMIEICITDEKSAHICTNDLKGQRFDSEW